jgi:hypothetical protein
MQLVVPSAAIEIITAIEAYLHRLYVVPFEMVVPLAAE